MQHAGKRFGQGHSRAVQSVVEWNQVALLNKRRGHSHEFRKCAVQRNAKRIVIRAQIVLAAFALPAMAATYVWRNEHPLPNAIFVANTRSNLR